MIKGITSTLFLISYYILAWLAYIVALPYLFYLSTKSKYKESIPARFFLYKNSFFKKSDIWFHACSLGEVKSIKTIIDSLNTPVNISVITNTGYDEAKKITKEVRFLPFEIWQPFWQKEQKVLVVMEAELWYMLFLIAKKRGDKTILLNARISDNSYKSYKRFDFFYKKIFENIDEVFAQSKKDALRLKELGAKNVKAIGNIKNSVEFKTTKKYIKPKDKRVIILASTHENEEEMILKSIKQKYDDIIIVVPRHPERFDKVDGLLKKYCIKEKKSYSRFSCNDNFQNDVILCDKMGELINLYAISDIVLLCGSFVDSVGGHNPLEPASFSNIIISGKYIFNQVALFNDVENIYKCNADEINGLLNQELKKAYIKNRVDIKPVIESIKCGMR